MSHQSAQHDHLLLNSVPQTPQQHHPPNLTAPIKSENDSDDDVVSLPTVAKILHSPDEYDPECQCSTCQLATKLLAECTCEQCGGTRQPGQSSENVPIANAVSPTNAQPFLSSIQNNDASTSEHTNANNRDDDEISRSSTPDYLPRFFEDESGDSSSDASEDDDDENDKELDQESVNEEDNDNGDPDYALKYSSSDDSENDDSVDDGDDSCDNMEVDKESESHNSNVHSQPSTSCQNAVVTNVDKSNLIDNELTNSDDEGTDLTPDKCPKCAKTFPDIHKVLHHYRGVHQEWKPFYCRWPKCNFASAIDFFVLQHAYRTHFKSQNRQKAKNYVGKRDESPPKDPVLEQIVANKFGSKKEMLSQKIYILNSTFNSNCPKCGRNFRNEGHFTKHVRTHAKSGFRCTFLKCGFFYCKYELAREHVLKEHLKGRLVNSTQLNEHLIEVDPVLYSSNRFQNNDASTSEQRNANDLDDVRERCSPPPDNLPRFIDDKSKDSRSDDSDDDDSVDDRYDGDDTDHTMEIESESEEDNDNRDPDYAFTDFQMMNSDNCEDDDSVDDATEHSQLSTSSSVSSDSSDNESTNLNSTETGSNNGLITIKCPKCERTFTQKSVLLRHYRGVHQEWKPYYCRWPKCTYTSAVGYIVVTHADNAHFNSQNRQMAKRFVGKREEAPPKDSALEQIDGIKFRKKGNFGQTRSSCPRCGRNFYSEHLKSHIRTHTKPGYRCTWPNCTFFFSPITDAKKHVRVDHLQVEQASSTQTNQYLVKVNPKTGKTTKVGCRPKRQRKEDNSGIALDNSENEEDSSSDDNGDENGDDEDYKELDKESEEDNDNSDQDYAFSDSSLDDNDEDDADHNIEIDKKSNKDNDNSNQDYAFSDSSLDDSDDDSGDNMEVDNESESLESIVYSQPSTSYQNSSETNENKSNSSDNKSANSVNESIPPTPVKCPKCVMTFTVRHKLLLHYRGVHQEWKPYICRWPKCDFTSAIEDRVITHADKAHFNLQNRQKARKCVGKRDETPPHDPALENIGIKLDNVKTKFGQTRSSCPQCGRNLYSEHLKKHIRTHANPGYSCAWTNCGFFFSHQSHAKNHLYSDHLEIEKNNLQLTKRYLVKVNPGIGKKEKVAPRHNKKTTNINSNCPKCSRNFRHRGHFKRHLRIHTKKGFCCTWFQCGFFYPNRQCAQNHLLKDHFKGKLVNATQISEHLVEVDPNLPNSNGLYDSIQNNDASTSEHTNANDQDHDHSRSSTPDYQPRFFDDESGDSSSDDSEDDDLVDGGVDQENECGDNDSDDSVDEDDDDKKLDQRSEHDDNSNGPKYDFLRTTLKKIINPTFACPQCKRNMPSQNHLEIHIPSHAKHGFRCTWSECGFFYSKLKSAKEHVCVDHLQVDKINSKYINKHLIKVDPKTGKTTKLGCRPRKLRKVDNSDNSEDEDTSSDDDGSSEM